jgi:hypothetical protein
VGIVVDIGFERFGYGLSGPERARFTERALRILVEEDYTTMVRDFVDDDVIQVARVGGQVRTTWVPNPEKMVMQRQYAAIGGSWDFAYWRLDELSVMFVYTLAFVRDGGNRAPTVVLPGGSVTTVTDLAESLRLNWGHRRDAKVRGAAKLHRFAIERRMVVHSE